MKLIYRTDWVTFSGVNLYCSSYWPCCRNSSNFPLSSFQVLCGNCTVMDTDRENICCHSYPHIMNILKANGSLACICELPAFRDNCLPNHGVLETSWHEYIELYGPFGDEHQLNKLVVNLINLTRTNSNITYRNIHTLSNTMKHYGCTLVWQMTCFAMSSLHRNEMMFVLTRSSTEPVSKPKVITDYNRLHECCWSLWSVAGILCTKP